MKSIRGKSFLLILLIAALPLAYNQCSGGLAPNKNSGSNSQQSLTQSGCPLVADSALTDLKTIDDAVRLANALPKPLTVDCFVANIKKPLKVFAVDNPFSAQPSFGVNSPRIFIISNNLTISVVPDGAGKDFIEFSLITGQMVSVKGEFAFPITGQLESDLPYTRILEKPFGTACRVCHQNENRNTSITTGEAYNSNILTPDPFKRISQSYLRSQASVCAQPDDFRCRLLKTIYIDGSASDTLFPTQPN